VGFSSGSGWEYVKGMPISAATSSARKAPSTSGPQTTSASYFRIRVASSVTNGRTRSGLRQSSSRSSHRSPWCPDSSRKCPRRVGSWSIMRDPPSGSPSRSSGLGTADGVVVSPLRHPIDEQRVRDRQHDGPDEEPDDAEGDQTAEHAGEDEQKR